MRETRLPAAIVALLLVALVPALYVTSYLVLVVPQPVLRTFGWYEVSFTEPSYRLGGAAAVCIDAPLKWSDRRLRPRYWSERIW